MFDTHWIVCYYNKMSVLEWDMCLQLDQSLIVCQAIFCPVRADGFNIAGHPGDRAVAGVLTEPASAEDARALIAVCRFVGRNLPGC